MDALFPVDYGSVLISSAILAGLFRLGSFAVREIGTKAPVTRWKLGLMYSAHVTPCLPIFAMISVVWGFYSHVLYVALLCGMAAMIVVWVVVAWMLRAEEAEYAEWGGAVVGKDKQPPS